jgi:ATP-dependent RNA helicase DDX3X
MGPLGLPYFFFFALHNHNHPHRIGGTTSLIKQNIVFVEDYEKKETVFNILLEYPPSRTLIFVEKKRTADGLDDFLYNKKFPTCSIHGDRDQRERELALRAFK